jgi:two-component system nitrogen regulation sensor histidine kinase NtrY
MISRNLYLNIIIRVILIVMFSLLLGYFAFINQSIRFSIIFFISIVLLTISLISYLNLTNKKIRFFFLLMQRKRASESYTRV